jgi:hypothetical protein
MGWVFSVASRPRFVSGKGPPIPIVQEAGWTSEPVWTLRLEEKYNMNISNMSESDVVGVVCVVSGVGMY